MIITTVGGNIFQSKANVLVNPVNCVGVMGKGLALEFKKRYPLMFEDYVKRCRSGTLTLGNPYFYKENNGVTILNFPTKRHWKEKSNIEDISRGLLWFTEHYKENEVTSIAFPALGCGNGGLRYESVLPLMFSYLENLPIYIEFYTPLK